ncbi:hypothetical protein C2E23DRAFT_903981 [Lenzites betulinus]|nr:hypothetical protein C2E23DRAFT_903981 [Lenzites betulinus]
MTTAGRERELQQAAPQASVEHTDEQKAVAARDWPQGEQTREKVRTATPRKKGKRSSEWKRTRWAWRSIGDGHHPSKDFMVERRGCLGVIQCSQCLRCLRPKTDSTARGKQLLLGCSHRSCPRDSLDLITCDARTYHYSEERDNDMVDIWEHTGEHEHPHPPRDGHLSKAEEVALDTQIKRRPDATAHQLRTGDIAPESTPLGMISPILTDARTARYQVNKGRERLQLRQPAAKGGGPVLQALAQLNTDLASPFLVDSGFVDGAYFIMQTPFMRQLTKENVNDALDPMYSSDLEDRSGTVTDSDHSYFKHGLLVTSAAFNTTLAAWVPIVYSWIGGQRTEDHRPHFRQLNMTIVNSADAQFEPRLLSAVMDFSAAQRAAYTEEYAATMAALFGGWSRLSPEAQAAQHQAFMHEASDFLQGCEVHFWRSGKRVQQNGALVPPDHRDRFERLLRVMLSPLCTEQEFEQTVQSLRLEFPRIENWISWWLQPLVARMLFPVKKTMSEETAQQLPRTSNPVETQHALLHHASGKGHDLIDGVRALFLHCQELERRHQAILDGHVPWPTGPRERPPRKGRTVFHPNDGRAPDTIEALALPKTTASTDTADTKTTNANTANTANTIPVSRLTSPACIVPATITLPTIATTIAAPQTQIVRDNNKFMFMSYRLSNSSCFTDHPLEAWFRAYTLWSPDERYKLQHSILPIDSVLASIFYHFEARLKWAQHGSDVLDGRRAMELCQRVIKHAVFRTWQLVEREDSHGCAYTWIERAVQTAAINSPETRQTFAIHHYAEWTCPDCGYRTEDCIPLPVIYSLRAKDIRLASLYGSSGTSSVMLTPEPEALSLQGYFAHFIPCRPMGNRHHGSDPIHELIGPACPQDGCVSICRISAMQTSWPRLLHILPETIGDTPTAYHARNPPPVVFPQSLYIPSLPQHNVVSSMGLPGDTNCIEYSLVGRILHKPGHFTGEYVIHGRTFAYDCARHRGKLVDIGDCDACTRPRHDVVMYIYTRRTEKSISQRSLKLIEEDFARIAKWDYDSKHHSKSDVMDLSGLDSPPQPSSVPNLHVTGRPESPSPLAPLVFYESSTSDVESHLHHVSPSLSPLQRTSPQSNLPDIVDCIGGCGEQVDEGDMVSCDLCQRWSHVPCIQVLLSSEYVLPKDYDSPQSTWVCPLCQGLDILDLQSIHDRRRIWLHQQYALFRTTPASSSQADHYSPARLLDVPLARFGSTVQLQWHDGNIYRTGESPAAPQFKRTLREVAEAILQQRSASHMISIGDIQWPRRLCEDAADSSSFEVPELSLALQDAFPTVMEILLGKQTHPVVEDFLSFMDGKSTDNPASITHFATRHRLNILPGDSSLVTDHLVRLRILLRTRTSILELPTDALVLGIAATLFDLVIMRTYLGRPPHDDLTLFSIIMSPRRSLGSGATVIRHLSHAEQAAAACEGAYDTKDPALTSSTMLHPERLRLSDTPLTFDGFIATITNADDSPYLWPISQDRGLTAGMTLNGPSDHTDVPQKPKPRPKPKPKPRQKVLKSETSSRLVDLEAEDKEPTVVELRRSKRTRSTGQAAISKAIDEDRRTKARYD